MLQSFYVAARGKVQGVTGLIISAAAMNAKRSLLMNTLQPFSTLLNYLAPNAAIVPALDPGIMARDPAVVRPLEPLLIVVHRERCSSCPPQVLLV